jgi:hypothetical protein
MRLYRTVARDYQCNSFQPAVYQAVGMPSPLLAWRGAPHGITVARAVRATTALS